MEQFLFDYGNGKINSKKEIILLLLLLVEDLPGVLFG